MKRRKWDVFISHASEDKDAFVRSFARQLLSRGLSVWYDELEIYPGDSLRRSVDQGLAHSDYVVVVLSRNFFQKKWTNEELAGVFSRETKDRRIIIPVWFGVTKAQVTRFSLILADRAAITSADPVTAADKVFRTVRRQPAELPPSDVSLDLVSTVEFTIVKDGGGQQLSHSISGRIENLLTACCDFMAQEIERRISIKGLATRVTRELLVNAIAHRDYTIDDNVSVIINDSMLSVSSPGSLLSPLTVQALMTHHVAVARNPRLAHDLYKLGYMELMGLGLQALRYMLSERRLSLPRFSDTKEQFVVEVEFVGKDVES